MTRDAGNHRTSHVAPPTSRLPILYFGTAHLSLSLAFFLVAIDPRSVAGFFYHSRIVGIVHLVTLGWISASILGALYIVAPVALRTTLTPRRIDAWAYGLFAFGTAGMVTHFWIEEFSGMAWSGLSAATAFALIGARLRGPLLYAPIPNAVKWHIRLAFGNVVAAGAAGVLLGFNKVHPFLPGFVLTNVFAHAHLAAVGWASMLVVGLGYRLLPMLLPSATPQGRSLAVTAILLQTGVTGLSVSLVLRADEWRALFACTIVAGLLAFLLHVRWMFRHRRPAPAARARPDYGVAHARSAIIYLILSLALGVILTFARQDAWILRAAVLYGTVGLVGFLAQIVVAMEARLLPLLAWFRAVAQGAPAAQVPPPDVMADRSLQAAGFWCWTAGVPMLAIGFTFDAIPFLRAGAWTMFVAVVLAGVNFAIVLWPQRHERRHRPVRILPVP